MNKLFFGLIVLKNGPRSHNFFAGGLAKSKKMFQKNIAKQAMVEMPGWYHDFDTCHEIEPTLIRMAFAELNGEACCRECGCTESNCSGCIDRTGVPCSWVEPDLCSACVKPVNRDAEALRSGARNGKRSKPTK